MLSTDTRGSTIGTTEDDGARHVTTRHVVGLATRVDDLVNGLHGKVPGHELAAACVVKVSTGQGESDDAKGHTQAADQKEQLQRRYQRNPFQ